MLYPTDRMVLIIPLLPSLDLEIPDWLLLRGHFRVVGEAISK